MRIESQVRVPWGWDMPLQKQVRDAYDRESARIEQNPMHYAFSSKCITSQPERCASGSRHSTDLLLSHSSFLRAMARGLVRPSRRLGMQCVGVLRSGGQGQAHYACPRDATVHGFRRRAQRRSLSPAVSELPQAAGNAAATPHKDVGCRVGEPSHASLDELVQWRSPAARI